MKTVLKIWDDDGNLMEQLDIPTDDLSDANDWVQQLVIDSIAMGWHYEIEFEPTFQDMIDSRQMEKMEMLGDIESDLFGRTCWPAGSDAVLDTQR